MIESPRKENGDCPGWARLRKDCRRCTDPHPHFCNPDCLPRPLQLHPALSPPWFLSPQGPPSCQTKPPATRLTSNRHLGPPGLGIKACFAKEALCLEKHPSPAAQSFKEPALFCAEKAPPDALGRVQADAGGPLISGQAPSHLRGGWT